jgi:hypothetical protein
MEPADVISLFIVLLIPTILIIYLANRFFKFRERKLEVEAMNAAEKAAQYASHSRDLEERVRVLEQIVTDGGAQTAAQIEALRSAPQPRTAKITHRRKREPLNQGE